MYNDYFGLTGSPFENTLDQRFLVLSRSHKEVLAALLYFVGQEKGFALVCGDVGTGKTMLINTFLARLPEGVHPILISNPDVEYSEILRYIAEQLNITHSNSDILQLTDGVKKALIEAGHRGQRFVLILDEAHLLSDRGLEHMRLLSNIEIPERKLLQILLVGQYELSYKLDRPEMRQLRQRINVNRFLEPLNFPETMAYVNHRLKVVGADYDSCFEPNCKKPLYEMTKGVPRRINQLCDNALLFCKALGQKKVNRKVLKKADKALRSDLLLTPNALTYRKSKDSHRLARGLILTGPYLIVLVLVGILGYQGYLGSGLRYGLGRALSFVTQGSFGVDAANAPHQNIVKRARISSDNKSQVADDAPAQAEGNEKTDAIARPEVEIAKTSRGDEINNGKEAALPDSNRRASAALSKPLGTEPAGRPPESGLDVTGKSDPVAISADSAEPSSTTDESEVGEAQLANDLPSKTIDTHIAGDKTDDPNTPPDETETSIVKPTRSEDELIPLSHRKIIIKKGETLAMIASKQYPDNPKLGLEAILLTNPEVVDKNKIYPGQTIVLPELDTANQIIQVHENKYYSPFATYKSFAKLQTMMQWLSRHEVKYLIENKTDSDGTAIYQVTLGGYDTLGQLKKAFQSAKAEEERGELWRE